MTLDKITYHETAPEKATPGHEEVAARLGFERVPRDVSPLVAHSADSSSHPSACPEALTSSTRWRGICPARSSSVPFGLTEGCPRFATQLRGTLPLSKNILGNARTRAVTLRATPVQYS